MQKLSRLVVCFGPHVQKQSQHHLTDVKIQKSELDQNIFGCSKRERTNTNTFPLNVFIFVELIKHERAHQPSLGTPPHTYQKKLTLETGVFYFTMDISKKSTFLL